MFINEAKILKSLSVEKSLFLGIYIKCHRLWIHNMSVILFQLLTVILLASLAACRRYAGAVCSPGSSTVPAAWHKQPHRCVYVCLFVCMRTHTIRAQDSTGQSYWWPPLLTWCDN